MRRVLHVGPANTPGGMATVIRTLGDNPPTGWSSQTIATHAEGSAFTKLFVWIKARRKIVQILSNNTDRPDIVHIHTAADWSFRRKSSIAMLCKKYDVPCIMHIHSGKFDLWLKKPSTSAAIKVKNCISKSGCTVVVLSEKWSDKLAEFVGESHVIYNPILPVSVTNVQRDLTKVLLMGRPDPIKGSRIAIAAIRLLRSRGSNVVLHLTGVSAGHKWSREAEEEGAVVSHGWMEKNELEKLRSEVGLLLVPSLWEGQPMVVIEAMARGIPILASKSCIDVVGDAGRIVDSVDVEAWATGIGEMLEDVDACNRMSNAGIERAKSHFIDDVNESWRELYDSLI